MSYIEKLFSIKNKVAVVTGATGQLGRSFCDAFTKCDVKTIGVDLSIDGNKVDGVEYFKLDITDENDVSKIFGKIVDKYRRIDILINNAGVSTFEPFEARSEESFNWVMDVNLKGTFLCIKKYIKYYDQSEKIGGVIINIGSIFGVVSPDYRNYTDCNRRNSEVYGATKAGVIQMTKYFAVHLAERNIRVNAVSPGGVFNKINPQGDDFIKNYSFRCPMNRMAAEEEIVGAVLFLSSNAASYTTGQNIVIDGGMSSW